MKKLLLLIISQVTLGQEKKIYYDANWKVSNKSNAKYYRLITLDKSGKSKGKVRDFNITGELHREGYFSSEYKYNERKNIMGGKIIWYF